MKKFIAAIPIAAMFAILALVFVFMCLPQKQNTAGAVLMVDYYFLRTRGLYCAVLGGVLLTAFYHLTLFVFRRREIVYLLFSVFCIASIMHFVFAPGGLNDIFHWIEPGVFLTRLSGVLSFLWHNTITIVGLYVLSRRFLLAHKKALTAYIVLGVAFHCFMPADTPFYRIISFSIILIVSIFVTAVAFMSPTLKENRWTLLYFISFVFYLGLAIMHIVLFAGKLFMPVLAGNLFMVLSQSVLLSKNYTDAFALVEETNANLEQLVGNRTKDLQNTNNAMRELIGNISHDLKTPLAVMSVNLEELLELSQIQSDEEYLRHVRVAYNKNLDLQRLIRNLIEISRIETGRSVFAPAWVSLSDLLSQAQDKYYDFLRSRDIFFEICSLNNAEIYIDPQRIWSVFDNIIYNAARHTKAGGAITINAAVLEETVAIAITDNGCGIEPEHLPHIFERFYKASASRGGSGGESGLGLYIVSSVMKALGGSVTAESETGKGTSIILGFVKKTN